jgi:hypothetical protein
MTWVFVVLAIVCLAASLALRHSPGKTALIAAGASMAFGLAAVIVRVSAEPREAGQVDFGRAGGYVLGRKVAEDFPGGGRLLVLYYPPLANASKEWTEFNFEGLAQALGESKAPFEIVEAGPNRMNLGTSRKGLLLFGADTANRDAAAWCRENAGTVAVVSLLPEMPNLSEPGMEGTTPWYGFFNPRTPDDQPRFTDPRLRAVVVPKYGEPQGPPPSPEASPAELFERIYRIATPNA